MHDDIGVLIKRNWFFFTHQWLCLCLFPPFLVNFACVLSCLCLGSSCSLGRHVDQLNCRFSTLNTAHHQLIESSSIVTEINKSQLLSHHPRAASAYPRKPPANRLNPPSDAFSTVSTRIHSSTATKPPTLFLNQPQVLLHFHHRNNGQLAFCC